MRRALIIALIAFSVPAMADPNFTPVDRGMSAKLPIPLPFDPAGLNNAGSTTNGPSADNDIFKTGPLAQIADIINSDFIAAAAAATADPDVQDPNGAACWAAFAPLGRIVKAHPVPATLHIAPDIENLRLVNIVLNKVCAMPACTTVFNDAAAWIKRIKSALPISTNIVGAQFNPFGDVCSNIPQISLAATTAAPVPPVVLPVPGAATSPTVPTLGAPPAH